LNKKIKAYHVKIIREIWKKKQRVTYRDFMEQLKTDETAHITAPTFSRILSEFLKENGIIKYRSSELQTILRGVVSEAIDKRIHGRYEFIRYVTDFFRTRQIYSPSPSELDRLINKLAKDALQAYELENINQVSNIIGKEIASLKFVKEFMNHNQYPRFPPVHEGKLGIKKLTSEYEIMLQIKDTFHNEGIEFSGMLQLPDIHFSKLLVEKLHPSEAARSSKHIFAVHLLKYYAARYQDSIDAIVQCFIKAARLMRFRANKSYEVSSGKDSRTFLEESNAQFQEIIDVMKSGDISVLEDYKEFFEMVAQKTGYYHKKEGYYEALASRYKYSRILSTKMSSLEFDGSDEASNALVAVLGEVFAQRKFEEDVNIGVINRLVFLRAPRDKLKDRRVFEPLVLVTLTDFIASGRIIVKHSMRYRDKWTDVPDIDVGDADSDEYVGNMKSKLDNIWEEFIPYTKTRPEMCHKGWIVDKRPPSPIGKGEELRRKAKIDAFIESLEVKDISKILWSVHEMTGFLDCFKLVNKGYHGNTLPEEERTKLALITVMARGMNVGLKGIVKSLHGRYGIGRLINFDENYVSIGNLEEANRAIIREWDALNCGDLWGDGCGCSSDGKVTFSFVNNLLSRFHYRKGRMGVTIYWFVRNDWIANYVQVIGNDEWESWYVIDGLLNSYCDKEVRQSCGDTQGQLLSLWGLGALLELDIRARFRDLKNVKLYKSSDDFAVEPLTDVDSVDWEVIKRCVPSVLKLVDAIKSRKIRSRDFLSTWNIYDENGINVAEGLREIGKVSRTIFILRYMRDKKLQQDIREGCNRAEFWNKFQDAVFWGKEGVISSNNPNQQRESALFLMLVMNAIVFYNKAVFGERIEKDLEGVNMHPAFWQYINFIGQFHIDDV
jgi:TnpA family transposase